MASDTYPHLGFDPAPGDLESTRALTLAIGRVIGGSDAAKTELGKMGSADGAWVGKSADAFTEAYAKVPPYLQKALTSLSTAHRALTSWERQLDGFQARARRLESDAAHAAARVSSAQSAVDALPSSTDGMTDQEKERHEGDTKTTKSSLDSATTELAAVRDRGHALKSEHAQAASDTARLIHGAADDAPPEPGWFDKAMHAVAAFAEGAWDVISDPEFWKLIGDILADVAMVIGVAAIFISGLGMAAFVVAALALAFHLAAKAGGADVSWETLAWDAVGVFAGAVSLGGARLARAGEGLVEAGRSLRLTSGFMKSLGEVRFGNIFKGLKGIPSGVSNTARGFAMAGKGWVFKGAGEMIDTGATWVGAALAIGSNVHNGSWSKGRWTDGKWEVGDIPVVGPLVNYVSPPTTTAAPAPAASGPQRPVFDPSSVLTSSGSAFTSHLDPSRFGTAA
ncbi:putative T7SS-secreted protein [Streptomyces sp. NPDC093221]|uniref:putative T7SS-secreted protein n=1 Tax=Streptomyces sp. NPDC093221 TaxID=3366032 RepID=UPI00382EA23F